VYSVKEKVLTAMALLAKFMQVVISETSTEAYIALLRRQKKSNKRKGFFFSMAPPKKRSPRLPRPALLSDMALVFCLSLTSIELFCPFELFIHQTIVLHHIYAKKRRHHGLSYISTIIKNTEMKIQIARCGSRMLSDT
jgi:hypothetical protein